MKSYLCDFKLCVSFFAFWVVSYHDDTTTTTTTTTLTTTTAADVRSECDSPFSLTNYTMDWLDEHWSDEIDFVICEFSPHFYLLVCYATHDGSLIVLSLLFARIQGREIVQGKEQPQNNLRSVQKDTC